MTLGVVASGGVAYVPAGANRGEHRAWLVGRYSGEEAPSLLIGWTFKGTSGGKDYYETRAQFGSDDRTAQIQSSTDDAHIGTTHFRGTTEWAQVQDKPARNQQILADTAVTSSLKSLIALSSLPDLVLAVINGRVSQGWRYETMICRKTDLARVSGARIQFAGVAAAQVTLYPNNAGTQLQGFQANIVNCTIALYTI